MSKHVFEPFEEWEQSPSDRLIGVEQGEEGEIMATLPFDELLELMEDSSFLKYLLENGLPAWEGYNKSLLNWKDKVENDEPPNFFNISGKSVN